MTTTTLETPCLAYRGRTNSAGYGRPVFPTGKRGGYRPLLHRWVVEQVDGPIPDGMVVMHLCDNPPCFRYDHLRVGTFADNTKDCIEKGRHRYIAHPGETNGSSRLTEAEVLAIRAAATTGASYASLGRQYGVSGTAVRFIVSRKLWRHLP